MKKIRVELPAHDYDIVIGRKILPMLNDFCRQKSYRRVLLVTDENVAKIYGNEVGRALITDYCQAELLIIPAGETAKTLSTVMTVYTKAIEMGLDRRSPIIAWGGGVVGDLAGFAAATYLRGVPLVQVPTTLLAQVDSGVGGKTAVNHPLGKNLIGAFYQPQGVFMDLDFLATLPTREISTGLGEIVKYGVIWDEEFFHYLEENATAALRLDNDVMTRLIARSCAIKAEVVAKDEKEANLRRILNFGHTVGHAIEKETGYARYNHGEAVAIGMVAAAYLSVELQLTGRENLPRLENLLTALKLPIRAENVAADNVYADLFRDKKTVDGKINWVLMKGFGQTVIRDDVPESAVRAAMQYIGASLKI